MLISRIRKKTKTIIYLFTFIFGISLFYVFGSSLIGGGRFATKKPKAASIPNIILRVDGKPINREIFNDAYLRLREQYEQQSRLDEHKYFTQMFFKLQALERLVNQEIFIQEAQRRNLRVTSGELNQQMRQYRDYLIGESSRLDDPSIQARVKFFFKDKEKDKYFRELLFQRGLTTTSFKESMRRDMFENKAVKAIGEERQKKEEVETQKRAESIMQKVNAGEDFATLATQYSDDESTRDNGGDRGWIGHGTVEKPFEDAAFSLAPGSISGLVKTESGYYIIKVENKKIPVGPDFEKERPDIIARLEKEKDNPKTTITDAEIKTAYEQVKVRDILIRVKDARTLAFEWLGTVREKHKVEVVNPELRAYRYLMGLELKKNETEINYEKALALYKVAQEKEPANSYNYYQMGAIYERMAEKSTSEKDPYQKAIEDSATSTAAAEKMTGKKLEYKRKALDAYREAFDNAKDEQGYVYDPMLYTAVARVYQELGEIEKARKYYAESVNFAAGDLTMLQQIEKALVKMGGAPKALKDARELIAEIEPPAPPTISTKPIKIPATAKGKQEK